MAKVSLRIYNREIESLVDQGHTDEAIAHCRHILKTFPKHLETYRLLGKSYLESRRYGEAVDIFSRVLMSAPDDFVSHVGMSIINDEQNRLDNAIWHMERAFEAQPSNAAIQGELQRLYARRDGMEPPKIRMTRGALAHMYVQGELYPQAIAEIRAVLAQDSQRTDMQVLLAKSYFKGGQKADASDICSQLLKKSPYCFDANRIMVELLPATSAESTQVYRMRVGELDPYATLSKESVFRANEVADAAINLERLEYTGEEVPIGQEWSSSLGIKLESGMAGSLSATSSSDEPDWLKAAATPGPQADIFGSSQPAGSQTSQSGEEIPDFLRAAGWGESSGEPEQPTSIFDSPSPSGGTNEDLVSASIPDWLKGQMPMESTPAKSSMPAQEPVADMDWLNGLTAAASAASGSSQPSTPTVSHGDMPDWLSGSDQPGTSSSNILSSDAPDWLNGLGGVEAQPAASNTDTPDWLSGASDSQSASLTNTVDTPDWLSGLGSSESQPAAQPASNVPDWLAGLGDSGSSTPPEPVQNSDTPDWLAGLDSSSPVDAGVAAKSDAPDWLSGFDDQPVSPAQPAANIDSLGASAQEQDDAVAWLESLAAKHGAKPEELVTDPNKRSDTAPEWVQQASSANESNTASPSTIRMEDLGSTAQEQDDAVAWLESLAAKHGAKPEELVTDPNKRSDTAPEWVQQASMANETPQPAAANIESLGASAQEQDDAVAWLESLAAKHGAKPEELVTDPSKRSDTAPDWVQQASAIGESEVEAANTPTENEPWSENAKNIGEQFFADFETASTPIESTNDETGMWLKSLEEKEAQDEAPAKEGNIPDWLSSNQPSAPSEAANLPNWMADGAQSPQGQEYVSENLSQDDLSNWLSNLDDGNAQPADASAKGLPDWLGDVNAEEEKPVAPVMDLKPASKSTDGPATVRMADSTPDELPDWLQGVVNQEPAAAIEQDDHDDSPPWLHRESWEAEERTIEPTPIKSSDWHPIAPAEKSPQKEAPKPAPAVAQVKQQIPSVQPVVAQPQPAAQPKVQAPKPQPKKPVVKQEPVGVSAILTQAKGELDRGDIPTALDHYGKLIKKGKNLEETIRDLTDSLYRYPVEVGIWQTLGDAYMRANRLKEALEAYNKAEELIR